MKIKYLCALLLAALVYSCDDSTTGIGDGLMPGGDRIPANTGSYEFSTNSLLADSVYARTSTAYLGRYTDEQFGEFSADFIAQFTCPDNTEFDEDITEITGLELRLFYTTYFGDSLNAMRMQVDTLDKVIPEKDMSTFYTSVNPADYYNENSKPIAIKAYSATGPSAVRDTVTNSSGTKSYNFEQVIKLPTSLGTYMYDKYKENKDNYKDAEAFIKNVLKGFYIRSTHGDGTILYIYDMQLKLKFDGLINNSAGVRDSVVSGVKYFSATKEVIQANHFSNSQKLKELVDEPNCTYIKSPAGIFTEATFPIEDIYKAHENDTLNGVSVTFTRYNDKSNAKYKMATPSRLLMVRKKDMFSFFEQNKITDSKTSFLNDKSSSSNTYTFSNIAPLVTYCIEERKKGLKEDKDWESKNPDWNKVVLIPVTVTTSQTTGETTGISNNLGMESAKLKGGTNPDKDHRLKMQIFYTTF
ncbi:DUF4270 domain-containing protein [Phocaeicola sp.]